ncbi:hypothetical protein [Rhodothermus marinus]|uniref:hypothetical protein n=1 Tax=Rhodothermus marinus TaxID=29549 RepID=UPI0006D0DDD1|nr:hypothetical protein [Rhodothermus marinus]
MGQQQLLLLVLGMVIVGIAVVAGIQAFSEGKQKAERDAAVSDAMRLISDIQAWMLKPAAFGGGGNKGDWSNVSLKAIGLDPNNDGGTNPDYYETINGCFNITGAEEKATLTIYGKNNSGQCDQNNMIAKVEIKGTSPNDVTWSYTS